MTLVQRLRPNWPSIDGPRLLAGFEHQVQEAGTYESMNELEESLKKLHEIDAELENAARTAAKVEQYLNAKFSQNFESLHQTIDEKISRRQAEYDALKEQQKKVKSETDTLRGKTEELKKLEQDFASGAVSLQDYVANAAKTNEHQPEFEENKLLDEENHALRQAAETFNEKRNALNEKIKEILYSRAKEILESDFETGVDFNKDKAAFEKNKTEFEELKQLYGVFGVSEEIDRTCLEKTEEKIKSLKTKYDQLDVQIAKIKKAAEKIERLVETESVEELKKLDLGRQFSVSGPYFDEFIGTYNRAVENAKRTIENKPEESASVFKLEEYMRKFKPVNSHYPLLPKIVEGKYKSVGLIERPAILEEKIKSLPYAEHKRDIRYMEEFHRALNAWKKSGPLHNMIDNSNQLGYAVDKMIACVEDYIQKSKERLIKSVVLDTTEKPNEKHTKVR